MEKRRILRLPKKKPFTDLATAFPNGFSFEEGLGLKAVRREGPGYDLSSDGRSCRIEYGNISDLMRALGQWLTRNSDCFSEEPQMDFRGLMIDSSRNGVMRPDKLREVMLRLALFGYNALCLYTEDTYEVRGHPEMGYLRGRYTQAELGALDRYAAGLGIEMFPCIQTLGHLKQILSHPNYAHLRDNESVLNLKVSSTFGFLEDIIEDASRPYASRRIHLGLDETWGLSTGRAFVPNTPIDPREDYLDHVNWLADLCRKKGLDPMMWGDIVIGMSGTEAFTESQAAKLPADMKMIFWNYYRPDHEYYRTTIRQYREMGFEPLVAPGLWSWGRLWGSQEITDASAPHFMKVAREEGVREALMTMWGDDGHEAPFGSSYPALAQFADDCWLSSPSRAGTAAMVESICGTPFETYILPSRLDVFPGRDREYKKFRSNLGKGILWDDPLLGIFARHYEKVGLGEHFAELASEIAKASRRASPADKKLFDYARKLSVLLAQKADLHNRARSAYLGKDAAGLSEVRKEIPRIVNAMRGLMRAHGEIWTEDRKPFGFEILQARYGGQLVRLEQMGRRLDDYLAGRADKIEEFDEKTVKVWPSVWTCKTRYGQVATMSNIR
ncbi:MAG: beta-N-acetylhexosaminidase [Theionarchaea archaeon]|nr:beta-N-acetylhexosaminidase [Theionarchaea archaeon]